TVPVSVAMPLSTVTFTSRYCFLFSLAAASLDAELLTAGLMAGACSAVLAAWAAATERWERPQTAAASVAASIAVRVTRIFFVIGNTSRGVAAESMWQPLRHALPASNPLV